VTVHLIKEWRALFLAVQFLTVIPFLRIFPKSSSFKVKPRTQGRSLIWYPAVGLILGVLLTIVTGLLPTPFYLTAAIVVALWVILTGGLHLDGLADCADAWMGGLGDRDKTLHILKDPLCGAIGVLSLVLLLLLKTAALAAMISLGHWVWLWAIPLLSRLSLLLLFLTTPYVRRQSLGEGLGEVLASHFPKSLAKGVLLAVSFVLILILPFSIWLLWMAVTLLVCGAVRSATLKRLKGFTGDIAGAQVELVEVALLVAVCFIHVA
jgi:adenosylcobinamide-GDP ribazoletransferase